MMKNYTHTILSIILLLRLSSNCTNAMLMNNRREILINTWNAASNSLLLSPEIEAKLTNFAKMLDNRTPDTVYLGNSGSLNTNGEDKGSLATQKAKSSLIKMPSIGYSLYGTKENIEDCVRLAIFNEVTMLDLATQYGTNA